MRPGRQSVAVAADIAGLLPLHNRPWDGRAGVVSCRSVWIRSVWIRSVWIRLECSARRRVAIGVDEDEYLPSPSARTRDQVALYESSGGTEGTTMRGMPVVVLTMRGAKTGKLRKVPLMRVEHDGHYAAVASMGGAPQNPVWYHNLLAHPDLDVQDGTEHHRLRARELSGDERELWWGRAVAAYPDYADYAERTSRTIPVFVLEPAAG